MIHETDVIESAAGSCPGLGLRARETTLQANKTLRNVRGRLVDTDLPVSGYEIHAGFTVGEPSSLFELHNVEDHDDRFDDGALSVDNQVMGTYLHGLFDESAMLAHWLQWAGMSSVEAFDYFAFRDNQIERLANVVEAELPLASLLKLLSSEN